MRKISLRMEQLFAKGGIKVFHCPSMIFLAIFCLFAFSFLPAAGSSDEFTESSYSFDADLTPSEPPLTVELLAEDTSIQPGHPFWIALRVKMGEHWHSYWKNPGDTGIPLQVEWVLPEGLQAGPLEWPYPKRFKQNSLIGFGFEGEIYLLAHVMPSSSLPLDKAVPIGANVQWLACSDSSCVPGDDTLQVQLPVTVEPPKKNPQYAGDFAKARGMLPKRPWHLQALRKNHLVELHLKAPPNLSAAFKAAYFCPDSKTGVDSHADTLLRPVDGKPGEYVLLLKDQGNQQLKTLKGILVMHHGQYAGHFPAAEALDISVPIQDDGQDEIASAADAIKPGQYPMGEGPGISGGMDDGAGQEVVPEGDFAFQGGIGLALVFAFLGGIILNLMPCVLPVMSFKVLSFVKMAGQSRVATFKHGLAFSAGVLLSFWVLAGLMLGLQAYGHAVGWGFQLQEPLFVAILAAILLLFGLSLFGVFELGASLTSLAGQAQSSAGSTGLMSSFLSGVLATAVATPCTGPFLGSAVGFAVTLPAFWALLIFTFLALGMASPYLVLAAYPQWLRFLPKPGPWMVTFKELMGFFMLATVVWLVWVFGAETNSFAVFLLLTGFLLLSIGGWIYGRWCSPVQKKAARLVGSVFAAACLIAACFSIFTATSFSLSASEASLNKNTADAWEDYSAAKVAELHRQGIPVLVDFTASWCLICQANHLVLSTAEVSNKLDELGVVRMKADWTKRDPAIAEALRKFGRNSVPLYLLYGRNPNDPPQVLPQVLTPDAVIQYLDKI